MISGALGGSSYTLVLQVHTECPKCKEKLKEEEEGAAPAPAECHRKNTTQLVSRQEEGKAKIQSKGRRRATECFNG